MSLLKTYDRSRDMAGLPRPWPYEAINRVPNQPTPDLMPGMWVELPGGDPAGLGMVIAVNADQLTVLWSIEPEYAGLFRKFAFPLIRKVQPSPIAQQIVSVQPMTRPSGLIFYLDYTYNDKLTKRCSTGPWVSKAFWRVVRWVRDQTKSSWSSFKRRFRKKSSPAEHKRLLLEKWSKVNLDVHHPWDGKPPIV